MCSILVFSRNVQAKKAASQNENSNVYQQNWANTKEHMFSFEKGGGIMFIQYRSSYIHDIYIHICIHIYIYHSLAFKVWLSCILWLSSYSSSASIQFVVDVWFLHIFIYSVVPAVLVQNDLPSDILSFGPSVYVLLIDTNYTLAVYTSNIISCSIDQHICGRDPLMHPTILDGDYMIIGQKLSS